MCDDHHVHISRQPVALVAFAEALCRLAKNDCLDAAMLTRYGLLDSLFSAPPRTRDLQLGSELLAHHSELVAQLSALRPLGAKDWRRFGRGNHPASLNVSDCFAYALASLMHEPLLFKGEDFSKTDVVAA